MPVINKQRPTNNIPQRVAGTSVDMLEGAVISTELEDFIRMSIYGANRVGKTCLACQFPKPLLLIQFEPNKTGGALSVKAVKGVVCIKYERSARGLNLCKQMMDTDGLIPPKYREKLLAQGIKEDRFASYVVDGCTSYQDIILQEVMGWNKMPEQLSFGMVGKERYQERAEKVKEGLRPFTNLPGNVVFLAKEKDHNPPKDDYSSLNKLRGSLLTESYFAEDVGGSVAGWLHDVCDYIGHLHLAKETRIIESTSKGLGGKVMTTKTEELTGRIVHRLRTLYHTNFAAGFRSSNVNGVPSYIEEPTFEKIQAVIDGTYKPTKAEWGFEREQQSVKLSK